MNYQLNSYVSHKEAETLKEMIFKRARERSESMTSDFQADIMNIARESFETKNNPFAGIVNSQPVQVAESKEEKKEESSELHKYVESAEELNNKTEQIGFAQKQLYSTAANQYRIIQDQTSARQIQETMQEARDGLTNKKSFMGALAFLNSQAAVSLLNKRAGKGLEIVA